MEMNEIEMEMIDSAHNEAYEALGNADNISALFLIAQAMEQLRELPQAIRQHDYLMMMIHLKALTKAAAYELYALRALIKFYNESETESPPLNLSEDAYQKLIETLLNKRGSNC